VLLGLVARYGKKVYGAWKAVRTVIVEFGGLTLVLTGCSGRR